jgi:hypothetical protein
MFLIVFHLCKSFMDYDNLYLKSDVLLLSDIWSNFREVCYKNYGLDCTYYYTSPSSAWDAMLKKTKVELELLTDNDKVLFVENGIRGGLSLISKRHAKANNKYIDDYDKSKEESYISYLDANNLQQKDYNECNITKLCCSLEDRKEYVVHYRMLKLALSLGFELTKVHKCLTYKQKPFLSVY